MRTIIALWILLLLFPLLCIGQEHTAIGQGYTVDIQHFSTEEGLSHRSVRVFFEDQDGMIWIGTKYGLNRYDGYQFKWWLKEDNKYNFNDISRIGQDDEGWLWLWNPDGVFFLHPNSEEIISLSERFDTIPFSTQLDVFGSWKQWDYRRMVKDQEDRLYLRSKQNNEIITYHSTEGFQRIQLDLKKPHKLIPLCIDSTGYIWAKHKNILFQFIRTGQLINKYVHEVQDEILKAYPAGTNGVFYRNKAEAEDKNEVFHISKHGEQTPLSFLPQLYYNPIDSLFNQFSDTSMHTLDTKGNLLYSIPFNLFYNSDYIYINDFFVDRHGRNWMGTGLGFSIISFEENLFKKHLFHTNYQKKTFANSSRGIVVKDSLLYVNCELGGLYEVNLKAPKERKRILSETFYPPLRLEHETYTYWGRSILAVDSGLWVGDRFHLRFFHLEKQTSSAFVLSPPYKYLQPQDIWSIYQDKNNILWLGTGDGLCYLKDNKTIEVFKDSQAFPELNQAVILNIQEDQAGQVWFCSDKGLYLFDPDQKKIISRYWPKGKGKQYLPTRNIQYLYQDKNLVYWLATDEGLLRWIPTNLSDPFRLFGIGDGFANQNIYTVLEDEKNHLWLTSDKGIIQFDKEKYTVRNYLLEDGITHNEFNRISYAQANDGRIYFGGMNGVTSFHPNDFYKIDSQKLVKPSMIITRFQQFEDESKELVDKTIELNSTRQITLQPDDLFFVLDLALLTYNTTKDNRYAYKIEGLEDTWLYQNNPSFRIGRLPYGNYQLKIRGEGLSNKWLPNEQSIELNVLAPFYLKRWFLLLLLSLLIATISLLFKWRTRQLEKRKFELEKEVEQATEKILEDKKIIEQQASELREANDTKDRIFSILGHDLRKPVIAFRGISKKINYLVKKEQYETVQLLGQDLEKDAFFLNRLIDNLLNWALTQKGTMICRPELVDLYPVVTELLILFQPIANQKKVQLYNEIPENCHILVDRNSIIIILRNLIDNALKFTYKGGTITIKTERKTTHLAISVVDTGVGIEIIKLQQIFALSKNKSSKGTDGEKGMGVGLHLIHELTLMNGGEVSVESEVDKGSTFTILLPSGV